VGLYISTEAGVIFIAVPCELWREKMQARVDSNGNPLPSVEKHCIMFSPKELEAWKRAQAGKKITVEVEGPPLEEGWLAAKPSVLRIGSGLLPETASGSTAECQSSGQKPAPGLSSASPKAPGGVESTSPRKRHARPEVVQVLVSRSSQVREERNAGGEAISSGGCAVPDRKAVTVAELIERFKRGASLDVLSKETGLSVGLLTAAFIRQGVALADLNPKTE
jgi:hypothetical protein